MYGSLLLGHIVHIKLVKNKDPRPNTVREFRNYDDAKIKEFNLIGRMHQICVTS